MKYSFKAKIYKTGINWCVDVPTRVTKKLTTIKGYVKVKGRINNFNFAKSLVPVKNSPHRLFVNQSMMKGGKTAVGQVAAFEIEQDKTSVSKEYPVPKILAELLTKNKLTTDFNNLTSSRKKDILKYLGYVKTKETLLRNIEKVITQLKNKRKTVRIP